VGTVEAGYGAGKMMQRLFFAALRAYVWGALRIFYRHIRVSGLRHIPEGAVLFTANHQNAFMDALLIVCSSGRYTHFLARADIFKKSWAKKLLQLINIIPIYRIRDGWQSLAQNQQTFDACSQILHQREPIVIFPEGNHGSARRLRPLSKGFTRVAFEALRAQPNLPLHIVPVGLNYSEPQRARSAVHIIYGTPLLANPYFEKGEQAGAQALRADLSSALQKLITHVPEERADVAAVLAQDKVDYLEPEKINAWIANPQLPLPVQQPTADIFGSLLRAIFFPVILAWARWDGRIEDRVFVASLKFAFAFAVATVLLVCVGLALLIAWW
jgi:1-acyl-sn-glycerol-3-phosphate acyltransferase